MMRLPRQEGHVIIVTNAGEKFPVAGEQSIEKCGFMPLKETQRGWRIIPGVPSWAQWD